jgi:hypothetical protein
MVLTRTAARRHMAARVAHTIMHTQITRPAAARTTMRRMAKTAAQVTRRTAKTAAPVTITQHTVKMKPAQAPPVKITRAAHPITEHPRPHLPRSHITPLAVAVAAAARTKSRLTPMALLPMARRTATALAKLRTRMQS